MSGLVQFYEQDIIVCLLLTTNFYLCIAPGVEAVQLIQQLQHRPLQVEHLILLQGYIFGID